MNRIIRLPGSWQKLKTAGRFTLTILLLTALLLWGLVINVNTGSADIPAGDVFRMIWDGLRYKVLDTLTGNYAEELQQALAGDTNQRIIFSIRMPRMLLAAVLGAAFVGVGVGIDGFVYAHRSGM